MPVTIHSHADHSAPMSRIVLLARLSRMNGTVHPKTSEHRPCPGQKKMKEKKKQTFQTSKLSKLRKMLNSKSLEFGNFGTFGSLKVWSLEAYSWVCL